MAKISGTVPISAPIAPTSDLDTFPSHLAKYGKGGLRTVATLAERNAIPTGRREEGMEVYVQEDSFTYQLGSDLSTWTKTGVPAGGTTGQVLTKNTATDGDATWHDVGANPIKLADGGTKTDTAIQVGGQANEGIYYDPLALHYNNLDHPAWLTAFGGNSGPGIFDFGIWLPVPPISSNPADPSSAGYLLFGPLVAGAGLWFMSTFRLPGVAEAPGKKCSWWGLNWIADGGIGTSEKWMSCFRDYPARPGVPGFAWPEASRSYVDFAEARPVQCVIPNGTLAAPALVFHRNFYHDAAANTGFASLAEHTMSVICQGVEVVRWTATGVTDFAPEDWGTAP